MNLRELELCAVDKSIATSLMEDQPAPANEFRLFPDCLARTITPGHANVPNLGSRSSPSGGQPVAPPLARL
jgi:hypothetical protein